jgi:hypothetical protein
MQLHAYQGGNEEAVLLPETLAHQKIYKLLTCHLLMGALVLGLVLVSSMLLLVHGRCMTPKHNGRA